MASRRVRGVPEDEGYKVPTGGSVLLIEGDDAIGVDSLQVGIGQAKSRNRLTLEATRNGHVIGTIENIRVNIRDLIIKKCSSEYVDSFK